MNDKGEANGLPGQGSQKARERMLATKLPVKAISKYALAPPLGFGRKWLLPWALVFAGGLLSTLIAGCGTEDEDLYGYVGSIGTKEKAVAFGVWGDPQVAYCKAGTKFDDDRFKRRFEQVNPRLQQAVELTNRLQPAFVVTLGDNIHGYGEWESFKVFVDIVKPLQMPLYLLMGNHDHLPRADHYETNPYQEREFGNFLWAQKQLGSPQRVAYSFDAGDWHLILYSQPGGVDAYTERHPEFLQWLDTDLKANRDRPTMFFTHHPLLPAGHLLFESYGPRANHRAQLMDILTRYGNVKYVFSGHVHTTVSAAPLISWRYRGAAFIVMPNSAHWARSHYYQEHYRSSQGVGTVQLNGKRCESITFHTLAGEIIPIATAEFPVYDDAIYAYLRPPGALPAGSSLLNGGFEQPLSQGWFVNHLMPYDTAPIQRRLLKATGAAEGRQYLYFYTQSQAAEGKYPANFLIAEVRQAVAVTDATGWPQLRLKYKLPSQEYRNPEDCSAYVLIAGHRKETLEALFTICYSLGRTLRVPGEQEPYLALKAVPELDRWSDLTLNVRSDYQQYFPAPSWDSLGLESLVVRLGVYNENTSRQGEPAEIGIGYDAVAWSVLDRPTPASGGFTAH